MSPQGVISTEATDRFCSTLADAENLALQIAEDSADLEQLREVLRFTSRSPSVRAMLSENGNLCFRFVVITDPDWEEQ